ncbi:uncharacterized protein LOC134273284 [Saccostrea cucullata]|uniref:uncharacterized protein LOC134273284 n=1 Tax=Saccostrea cuccullata TaxID=36930 RepID=UPI002ED0DD59
MRRALNTLFTTYPAFSRHLQDASHTNAKANGLARLLESSSIMTYAGLLLEIISPLVRLSLTLQRQDITIGDARVAILATVDYLKQYDPNNSEKLQGIIQEQSWAGYELKGGSSDVKQRSCSTVEKIIEKISERYQDLSGELLDATTIGSLKNWPIENQETLFVQ